VPINLRTTGWCVAPTPPAISAACGSWVNAPRDRWDLVEELGGIRRDLSSARDVIALCERLVTHARRLTGAATGIAFLREDQRLRVAVIRPPAMSPDVQRLVEDAEAHPISQDSFSIVSRAAAMGTNLSTSTALVVPLAARETGDGLGVLVLTHATTGDGVIAFEPESERLVGLLVEDAAATWQQVRVSRRADKLIVLSQLTRAISSAHDSKEACEAIAKAATTLLGAAWARVWADDPVERVARQLATYGRVREIADLMSGVPVVPYGVGLVGRIAESHTPEYIRDIVHDPRWVRRRPASPVQVHGFAGLPLRAGTRMVGVLSILFDVPHEFDSEDKQLSELLADHAAIALDNARSYEDAQEQLRTTRALLAVAQALSGEAPVDELMRRVGRELVHAVGADVVGAYLLDVHRSQLIPVAGYRVSQNVPDSLRREPLVLERAPGLAEAIRDRRVIWSRDGGNDPRFDQKATSQLPPHSALFAPTVVRGEATGGLYLGWWRPGREFLPSEIQLIEGIAAQLGLALGHADLARQTETKLRETETLLSVSRALSSTLDLQSLLRHFLRRVALAVDADTVGSYMLAADGEWLRPLQGYRLPPEHLEALRSLGLSIRQYPFYAEGADTKRPVFSQRVAEDPRIPRVVLDNLPHQSQLFVPIVSKDRVIGGLVAVWWDRTREFSEGDLDLIEAIATQAGVALENARLFQENGRQVKELSVLHALSRAVTGELDRRSLIEALYDQVARVFDARQMVIYLRGATADEVITALRTRDGERDPASFERSPMDRTGLAAVVLKTGHPLRAHDYAGMCARHGVAPEADASMVRYWLGIPMTTGDGILGVIALASAERRFTADDERLLANIGHLAALALRSAQLFEEREAAYGELAAAQDQLVRTEKLRALGEMASGVAHDFNNVLAAVLGCADMMLKHSSDTQLRNWAGIIERAAADGAHTVRRLQEFTRVRRDRPAVPVDLNAVVRGALEMTQSRWRDEPARRSAVIELRTSLPPVASILGDPAELREALTNLILNALDAMPNGGVLSVATTTFNDAVRVTVSDTGIGMPEHVQKKIFDPFFTTKGPQGTGLGLSMTYGILVRHEAQITVESQPGKGSAFHLTFPARDAVAEAPASRRASLRRDAAPLKCLVIDDDQLVAEVVSDMLTEAGHQVIVITDPLAAIARIPLEHFDVVVTDLAMPSMPGWQVARTVKALSPSTPVLLITGYGVELSPEERKDRCVDLVLTKPVSFEEMVEALETVVSRTSTN
jgi:GAF domain-containing protein/ActR/RegA family two-component response regulator